MGALDDAVAEARAAGVVGRTPDLELLFIRGQEHEAAHWKRHLEVEATEPTRNPDEQALSQEYADARSPSDISEGNTAP